MTERKLRDGQTFNYASEHSCATIGYLNSHWFYVELNGVCVYIQTIDSVDEKLRDDPYVASYTLPVAISKYYEYQYIGNYQ